jgi:hypothetical protein
VLSRGLRLTDMESQHSPHYPPLVIGQWSPAANVRPNCIDQHPPLRALQRAGRGHEFRMHVIGDTQCKTTIFADFFAWTDTGGFSATAFAAPSRRTH